MRKLTVSILIVSIILCCFLSGCQFGSYAVGGTYYSSPKEAFNDQASMNAVSGLYSEISSEIGIYPINSDYAVCLAMMDYTRNNEFVSSEPSALLMKTREQEYYFMGEYYEYLDFELVDKLVFRAEGVNYDFYITKEELFDATKFNDEKFVFYETVIDINGEKHNFKIAVGESDNIA